MQTTKMTAIKNGSCYSRTGSKKVVFTPKLKLRPVLYAVYSGPQPDRGTVQGALPNDLVATVVWGSHGEEYEISRFGGDSLPPNDEVRIWVELKRLHPWLDSWLEPSGRGATWLPEEVIPEADYLAIRAKRARIARAIDSFGLPYEVKTFIQDAKADLRLEPRPLDIDPDTIQPVEYHWSGSVVGISQFERWFGSYGDGSPAIPLDTDPDYTSGSNYAHSVTSSEEGSPGIIGWREFRFIVRVRHGAHTREHYSHGHTVDVWEVPEEARHENA